MKEYMKPTVEIVAFSTADVICASSTTSQGEGGTGTNELGGG